MERISLVLSRSGMLSHAGPLIDYDTEGEGLPLQRHAALDSTIDSYGSPRVTFSRICPRNATGILSLRPVAVRGPAADEAR